MFVRFRERNDRLLVSLVETHRRNGKVRQEHVADLGSIEHEPTIEARMTFWRQLHERLNRLSNRVDPAKVGHILGAVHARVPMATADELPTARAARIERNLKFWRGHREFAQAQIEASELSKAKIEQDIARWTTETARAQSNIEAALAAQNDPNAPAPVELTYKQMTRILREEGVTKQDAHRARKLADLTEEEFEARLKSRRFRNRIRP